MVALIICRTSLASQTADKLNAQFEIDCGASADKRLEPHPSDSMHATGKRTTNGSRVDDLHDFSRFVSYRA